MERWLLDVRDGDGNALVLGVGVVINTSLLSRFAYLGAPSGMLVALPNDDADHADPAFDDLGARVQLFYMSAAEVAALRASS